MLALEQVFFYRITRSRHSFI